MDSIVQWLQDTGIVMLNGLLTVLYFVWEQGPTVVSLVIATLVMAWPDRSVQKVAGHRPRRRQRGAVVKASPVAMIATAVTAAVWAVASFLSRSSVTLWGRALWFALLISGHPDDLPEVHVPQTVLQGRGDVYRVLVAPSQQPLYGPAQRAKGTGDQLPLRRRLADVDRGHVLHSLFNRVGGTSRAVTAMSGWASRTRAATTILSAATGWELIPAAHSLFRTMMVACVSDSVEPASTV